jgi:hypothetical protein
VGRPALAETPHHQEPQDDPSRCREHRDRATRPRAPDPASDGTAPRRPERSSRASDRPGPTGDPRARGTPPPRSRTTHTMRAAGRGTYAGDQGTQHRSGCPQRGRSRPKARFRPRSGGTVGARNTDVPGRVCRDGCPRDPHRRGWTP